MCQHAKIVAQTEWRSVFTISQVLPSTAQKFLPKKGEGEHEEKIGVLFTSTFLEQLLLMSTGSSTGTVEI